jgi:hypothetical protein
LTTIIVNDQSRLFSAEFAEWRAEENGLPENCEAYSRHHLAAGGEC